MIITANHLIGTGSGSSASSYNTASISPGAKRLVLLYVQTNPTSGTANQPTVTGAGMTWTAVISATLGGYRETLFRALSASPGSGALTIDFAGQNQNYFNWIVYEFIGVDPSGTNGANAIVQAGSQTLPNSGNSTGITVTLGAFGNINNATYGAIASSGGIATGGSFTELSNFATGSNIAGSEWAASNQTAVNWTWGSSGVNVTALAVEIKALQSTGFLPFL